MTILHIYGQRCLPRSMLSSLPLGRGGPMLEHLGLSSPAALLCPDCAVARMRLESDAREGGGGAASAQGYCAVALLTGASQARFPTTALPPKHGPIKTLTLAHKHKHCQQSTSLPHPPPSSPHDHTTVNRKVHASFTVGEPCCWRWCWLAGKSQVLGVGAPNSSNHVGLGL